MLNSLTSLFATRRSRLFAALAGLVALHIADDNFLQPNAGTSAGDHLVGGLILLGLVAAAILSFGRARAGVQATLALLTGFLGLLIATEAVHYTREHGPEGDDFTGLLSIPAGLALVALGAVTLWQSRRRNGHRAWRYGRRALVTAGVAVVGFIVLFPVAFSYAITHAARAYVPEAELGVPHEDVEFTTSDGLQLKGWYIRSKNGAAVISFPGRASSQERAKFLAKHGYGVLLFDRRGEGESEGDPNLLGWQGERDIHAAVEFLQRQPDVDPQRIGGIGLSVGGEMMIEAAAESTELKAIVSEGASARSHRDDLANGSRFDYVVGSAIFSAATSVFTSDLPPADLKSLVPKAHGAVFFIYGEKGQPAEEPANTGFYKVAHQPKEIWEVPGSGHMAGTKAQPKEYERRVVSFFNRHLLS